jgi:Uncharacterized conserved protein (DUF2304)
MFTANINALTQLAAVVLIDPVGHISPGARLFVLLTGAALCVWVVTKIRRRAVLIPTCTLFLAIGAGIVSFSACPSCFDRLSWLVGINYPPILYCLLAILSLMLGILHFATRLSIIDERCRKLAQEVALLKSLDHRALGDDGIANEPAGPSK